MTEPVTGPTIGPERPARAWGWVEHLRAGGVTPWTAWTAPGEVRREPLPGAQQLELLRRLNGDGTPLPGLVERVLAASVPGRGRLPLDLAGVPSDPFGAAPVDPATLPADELLRVGTGVLADLALDTPETAVERVRRPRLRRARYRLGGDPLLAASYSRQLRRQGRPPGGPDPQVLLLVTDLGTALADTWASKARRGAGTPWRQWIGQWADRGTLPPRADLVGIAEHWAARIGVGRVHLVADPALLTELLHADPLEPPRRLSHAALDVVRRVGVTLRMRVGDERRRHLSATVLVPWLTAADLPGLDPPQVDDRHRDWLGREADRAQKALGAAGYPVHGAALDRLTIGTTPVDGRAAGEAAATRGYDTVTVLVRALHRAAAATEDAG